MRDMYGNDLTKTDSFGTPRTATLCGCGASGHQNQVQDYPVGSRVELTTDIACHVGTIPAGILGKVTAHCDDGRAWVFFDNHAAGHTFHGPETCLRVVSQAPLPDKQEQPWEPTCRYCGTRCNRETCTHDADGVLKQPTQEQPQEWSGSCDPCDPANYWIDDVTGERVSAETGERSTHTCPTQEQPRYSDRFVDLTRVNLELFTAQRRSLNQVLDDAAITTPEQSEHLQGLQILLDHIYDELVPVEEENDR